MDYTPWLDVGTDTSATAGFQGDFSTLHVDDTSPQSGAVAASRKGSIWPPGATPTVIIEAGTYPESVAANKANLTLRGATGMAADVVIDPPGTHRCHHGLSRQRTVRSLRTLASIVASSPSASRPCRWRTC